MPADPSRQPPASAHKPVTTTGETVVVMCRLPMGHVARLHNAHEIKGINPMSGQQTVVKEFHPTGESIFFKGPAHAQDEAPRVVTASGYAMTFGVPKDFWDRWLDQHKELDLVRSNMIYAEPTRARAADHAREHKGMKTGFERIDPTKKVTEGRVTVEADPDNPVKLGRLDSDEED